MDSATQPHAVVPPVAPVPTNVAVIGTGIMGAAMATNLARAGFAVRAWNRSPARSAPLAEHGVRVVAEPADAVSGADVVLTMLFDAAATIEVMSKLRPALTAGTVWIQAATVGVPGCAQLADLAADLELVYVDAPVLGTKKPAEDGMLTILASGPDAVRDRCAPVFDAISSRVVWAGPAGQGSRLKLACNAWVVTVVEGTAEILKLAKGLGVESGQVLEALAGGPLDTPFMRIKAKMIEEGEFPASFGLDAATKDTVLIMDQAREAELRLPLLEAVAAQFAAGIAAGHGHLDLSATYLTL